MSISLSSFILLSIFLSEAWFMTSRTLQRETTSIVTIANLAVVAVYVYLGSINA